MCKSFTADIKSLFFTTFVNRSRDRHSNYDDFYFLIFFAGSGSAGCHGKNVLAVLNLFTLALKLYIHDGVKPYYSIMLELM